MTDHMKAILQFVIVFLATLLCCVVCFGAEATTQQAAPEGVVDQFFNGIVKIIGALGGVAGVTALVVAWINRAAIKQTNATAASASVTAQNTAARGEQIAAKVNEVAEKNLADVAPLPPPPAPLVVTPPQVQGDKPC